MRRYGIDVSEHQGSNIDWAKVKDSGVQFALLRCGYGMDLKEQDDSTFLRNAKECERLGIPYGVYLYSYAKTTDSAKSEAAHAIRLLKGRKLDYPVYFDLEDETVAPIGKAQILTNAKTFVTALEKAGYWAGVYANLYWWNTYLTDSWYDRVAKWVAQFNNECQYQKEYGIWQYSNSGKVPGIPGRFIDLNYAYVDYPSKINKKGTDTKPTTSTKTVEELAKEVIDGKWGNGQDRVNRLTKAGYNASAVQDRVNSMLSTKKSVDEIAKEVIDGKWGNGQDRVNRLTKAGYNASAVQDKVNALLSKKSVDEIAREVIAGKWGNGQDRVNRLTKAGYNASAVQKRVNELL